MGTSSTSCVRLLGFPTYRAVARAVLVVALTAISQFVFLGLALAEEPTGSRWALLIGVDDYAEVDDLTYCGADMEALRERLLKSGFPEDHIFVLRDEAEEAKYRPSKLNIERQLEVVLSLAEAEDMVVFAFSGHGVQLDQQQSYLCPTEAQLDNPASLVSLAKVYEQLRDCPASFKLALVDACRDDPRLGGQRSAARSRSLAGFAESLKKAPEGTLILTSCAPGQVSMEEADFGHGVFMNYVLEALDGQADSDQDQSISLGELSKYVSDKTRSYVARKFNKVQKPSLLGSITVDVLDYSFASLAPSRPLPKVPAAGETITNSIGMKLRLIPAGEFMMGSPESEEGRDDKELQHRVRITRPFILGVYEVTKGQFAQFVDATGHDATGTGFGYNAQRKAFDFGEQYTWRSWGVNQSDESPVVNVSWDDAQAFCDWLSRKEERTYRLPTEAEWEYACRAGTTTRYSSGDSQEDLLREANVADASLLKYILGVSFAVASNDGWPFTSPVGKFRANAWGIYDMHGNAAEWCRDWYGADYYATSPREDPRGPETGEYRVARGGGWGRNPVLCRASHRFGAPPDQYDDFGFRVVREP